MSLTLIESVSMIGSMVIPLLLAPYLYDGDTVSLMQWLGCALVFVSVFLFMNRGKKKQERRKHASIDRNFGDLRHRYNLGVGIQEILYLLHNHEGAWKYRIFHVYQFCVCSFLLRYGI